MASKKSSQNRRELRSLRIKQLIFISIGVLVILSMVLSLMTKY